MCIFNKEYIFQFDMKRKLFYNGTWNSVFFHSEKSPRNFLYDFIPFSFQSSNIFYSIISRVTLQRIRRMYS